MAGSSEFNNSLIFVHMQNSSAEKIKVFYNVTI